MGKIHNTVELEKNLISMEQNFWKIIKGEKIDKNVNVINHKLKKIRRYYLTAELTDYERRYVFNGFFGQYGINKEKFKESVPRLNIDKLKQIKIAKLYI